MGISGAVSRDAGPIWVLDRQYSRLWRQSGITSQSCDTRSPSVRRTPVGGHHRGGSRTLGSVAGAQAEDRRSETWLDGLYSGQTYVTWIDLEVRHCTFVLKLGSFWFLKMENSKLSYCFSRGQLKIALPSVLRSFRTSGPTLQLHECARSAQ